MLHVTQQADGLQSFPQTLCVKHSGKCKHSTQSVRVDQPFDKISGGRTNHFISKDTVDAVLI